MHTILLLHGVMASTINFLRNQRDLEALGWPVVALDLPGHGDRPAVSGSLDDIALDIAARLDETTTHLVVGHSLGAVVGLCLARRRPDLVSGVILEDPPGLASIDAAAISIQVSTAAYRARTDPGGEIADLLQAGSNWSRQDAEDAIRSRQMFDVAAFTRFFTAHQWDLPALVAQCPVPVHLIAATEPGTALRGHDRERLLALIPPDRVRIVESEHSVHRDRPGLWLLSVVGFAELILLHDRQ